MRLSQRASRQRRIARLDVPDSGLRSGASADMSVPQYTACARFRRGTAHTGDHPIGMPASGHSWISPGRGPTRS
jgi:hypothetical protein